MGGLFFILIGADFPYQQMAGSPSIYLSIQSWIEQKKSTPPDCLVPYVRRSVTDDYNRHVCHRPMVRLKMMTVWVVVFGIAHTASMQTKMSQLERRSKLANGEAICMIRAPAVCLKVSMVYIQ